MTNIKLFNTSID